MSRKRKAKHRSRSGWDKHHLLFYRTEHSRGYRLLLRRAFVYQIPIPIHQDLHSNVGPVPPLSDSEARWLWCEFNKVDHEMDIIEALIWLKENAPNDEFAAAINEQYEFLRNKIKAV